MSDKPSRRKWLLAGLAVSLAINLFFIGIVAGRIIGGMHTPPGLGDPTLGYARGLKSLPPEQHAVIRPILRRHFLALRPTLRQIRPAQREVIEALRASPFDARALEQALAQLRHLLGMTQTESHASLVEVASTLSTTQRRQLADFMQQTHRPPFPERPHPRPPQPE